MHRCHHRSLRPAPRATAAGRAATGEGCAWLAPRTDCDSLAPTGVNGLRWGFCCGAEYCCRGCSHEPCGPERCWCVIKAPWVVGTDDQFSAAVLIVLMDVEQDARTAALVGEARWVGSPSDRVMTGPSALRMSLGPSPIPRHVRRATASMSTRSGTILPSGQDCPDSNGRASLWACANR